MRGETWLRSSPELCHHINLWPDYRTYNIHLPYMKKLAFSLLAVVLFFSACSKDDDNTTTPANSFTIDGKVATTPYGYKYGTPGSGAGVSFLTVPDSLVTNYTGTASGVDINMDTLINNQTFTYSRDDSSTYNKTKNFYGASVFYNASIINGEMKDSTGIQYNKPTGGTVTVKITGNIYTFDYSLQFDTKTITGKFSDTLTVVE